MTDPTTRPPGPMTDPTTQPPGQCPNCRALVAPDQSYCLSCGARQGGARMPFDLPGAANVASAGETVSPAAARPARDWTPVLALGGLAALALVLVIGVLIGRGEQSNGSKVAAAPQVITLQGGAGTVAAPTSTGPTASVASASISEDWPSGKSGWTVELQKIAKSGATVSSVNAAKATASGKGATAVGVLDGSNHNSLGNGYIIYSGLYSTQAQANAALAKLKKSFTAAKVIHVVPSGGGGGNAGAGAPISAAQQQAGAAAIQQLNSCSGSACSKAARKITAPIATPGTPPPKDNKAPGGGSGGGQSFQ
jgi:hypothetical protein